MACVSTEPHEASREGSMFLVVVADHGVERSRRRAFVSEETGWHFRVPLFFLTASDKALTGRKQVVTGWLIRGDHEHVCVYMPGKGNLDIITLQTKCLTVTAQEQHIAFSG